MRPVLSCHSGRGQGGWHVAFTLIELLVVISILVLLMALLLPTLQRVRRQGKAMACRSNLRQWGIMFYAYTEDNKGRFFESPPFGGFPEWCKPMSAYHRNYRKLLFCPMATKHWARPEVSPAWGGGKYWAWDLREYPDYGVAGSYGLNDWIWSVSNTADRPAPNPPKSLYWQTCLDRQAHSVPVLLDAMFAGGVPNSRDLPPDPENVHPPKTAGGCMMGHFCVNRHDGYENCLFMDWSVRRIGLKELWTLKWSRQFNTRDCRTKAGGVPPEDWPVWMRRFKDY